MDAKLGDAAAQKNGYEPSSDLIQEQDCDTLLIYLPGFRKEQLRVQLAKSGTLRVSGTRPIGDNKLSSFQKDYPALPNCDINNITAKFEGGILYVRQPKLIVPAEKEDEKSPVLETQPAQRPVEQRPPTPTPTPTPTPSRPKKDQENDHTKKTSISEAQIKRESADDFRYKSDPKPVEEGKVGEPKDDKNEKTGTIDDDQRGEPSITDQHEELWGTESKFADKRTGKAGKDGVDYYKLVAAGTAAKLRKSGKITYMVMAIILAFAFGMYVNNLIWCSNKPEK